MSNLDQRQYLVAAVEAAVRAGAILCEEHGREELGVEMKGDIDLVTRADHRAEQAIAEVLLGRLPGHRMLGEEAGSRGGDDSAPMWVVDPLDGTVNFSHRYPFFCVSVALYVDGGGRLGLVYDPLRQAIWWALAEGTAMRSDGMAPSPDATGERLVERLEQQARPIRVSGTAELIASLCVTGFPYELKKSWQIPVRRFVNIVLRAQGVRRDGAAALDLCLVAEGTYDAFWETGLKPWDMAAGVLIVERAGGRVSGLAGEPFDLFRGELTATNGRVHEAMVAALALEHTGR